MTLQEAKEEFERRFQRVILGTPSYKSQTGEVYATLYSGGPEEEGVGASVAKRFFATEEAATDAWLASATAYADAHPGAFLYWRESPNDEPWKGQYRVYSRLLISDRLAEAA